jgi:hypothetical protein
LIPAPLLLLLLEELDDELLELDDEEEDELLELEELELELLELLDELEEDELLVVPSHTPRLVYQPQEGQ